MNDKDTYHRRTKVALLVVDLPSSKVDNKNEKFLKEYMVS